MVAILFLGGAQVMTIGVVGEYLGRMFDETKQRPLYFVKDYQPAGSNKIASRGRWDSEQVAADRVQKK